MFFSPGSTKLPHPLAMLELGTLLVLIDHSYQWNSMPNTPEKISVSSNIYYSMLLHQILSCSCQERETYPFMSTGANEKSLCTLNFLLFVFFFKAPFPLFLTSFKTATHCELVSTLSSDTLYILWQ